MIDPENYDFHEAEFVGQGCCGEVSKGLDSEGRQIALKRFNSMAIDRHFLEQNYRRYARLSKHPGIVDIHGYQFMQSPYFIVMDWIDGKKLDEIDPLSEVESWQRIYEVADALAHLHKHGLVHTNLHPGNIFVTDDSRSIAKITDFGPGLAGKVHHIDLGEHAYFAPPEQLEHPEQFDDKIADQWDVYRFGVIAFWLINGTLPRGHQYVKDRGEALAAAAGRPVPVDNLQFAHDVRENPDFRWNRKTGNRVFKLRREIVDRCLSLDPNDRPMDMREVRTSFRALEQQFVLEDAEDRVVHERKLQRMKLIVTRSVAACLAISLGTASYFLVRYLHRNHSLDTQVNHLEHVKSSQEKEIEKRDRLLSEIEHDLKSSREAADSFFSRMAQGTGAGGTGVGTLKQSELDKSRNYYLTTLGKMDETDYIEKARALHSLAHLELRMKQPKQAKERFQSAIAAFETVLEKKADQAEVVADADSRLADCYENISHLLGSGTGIETLNALGKASELFSKLRKSQPNDYDLAVRQAGNDFRLGTVFHLHRRFEEAIAAFSRAAETADSLHAEAKNALALQEMISELQFRVARTLRAAGRYPEAVDANLAAIESLVTLKGDGHYTPQQTLQMSQIYVELGELFNEYATPEERDQLFNESLRLLTPLNEKEPENIEVAMALCRSLTHLGSIESEEERWSEGYRLSVKGIEYLVAAMGGEEATHIEGLLTLAEARARHINLLKYQEDAAKKITAKGVATVERAESIVKENREMEEPIRRTHQFRMAGIYEQYGELYTDLGDKEAAKRCFNRASATRDLLAQAGSDVDPTLETQRPRLLTN